MHREVLDLLLQVMGDESLALPDWSSDVRWKRAFMLDQPFADRVCATLLGTHLTATSEERLVMALALVDDARAA